MNKKSTVNLIAALLAIVLSATCAHALSFDTISKVVVSETDELVKISFVSNDPIKYADMDVRNEAGGNAVICDILNARFDTKQGDVHVIQKSGVNLLQTARIKDNPMVSRATFILDRAIEYKVYRGANEVYIHFFKKTREEASSVKTAAGGAQQPASEKPKYGDLLTNDSIKFEFHIENLPIEEVVKKFAAQTKLNVILKENVSGKVTAHTQGTLYEVLEGVFKYNGYNYSVGDSTITISGRNGSENMEVSLKFRELSFQEIAEAISEMANINLMLDKSIEPTRKISFYVHKMKVVDAIKLLANMYDYVLVKIDDGSYVITVKENEKIYAKKIKKLFNLKNAAPKDVIELITRSPEMSTQFNVKNFSVDERTSSLMVYDTPRNVKAVEDLIQKIDQGVRQVDIEVKLVEVSRDSLNRLGVKTASALGFSDITQKLKVENINATMEFLENQNKAKVLASPRLLVVNGRNAQTHIGEQIPVPVFDYVMAPNGSTQIQVSNTSTTGTNGQTNTGGNQGNLNPYAFITPTTTTNGSSTNPAANIAYLPIKRYVMESIGIKLNILPKIHSDTEVTIDLSVEVSSLLNVTDDGQIHKGTRNTQTMVRLKDNNTAVFGGIIKQDERTQVIKVPLLGDIPRLGKLFTHTTKTKADNEMIMLITPHITPFDMPRNDEKNDGVNEVISSSMQY